MARTAVEAGVAERASKRALGRQRGTWASQHGAVAPRPTAVSGPAAELLGLARLRDAGVLSEEEFAAKKRRILGI
jgi:hypothetical protein